MQSNVLEVELLLVSISVSTYDLPGVPVPLSEETLLHNVLTILYLKCKRFNFFVFLRFYLECRLYSSHLSESYFMKEYPKATFFCNFILD